MKSIICIWNADSNQMGVRGVIHLTAFIILISTLLATGSQNMKRAQELSAHDQISSDEINGDMAELLWLNCKLELISAKEAVDNLELYVPKEKSSGSDEIILSRLVAKEIIQKALSNLHPQVKQTLLNCVRKKNLMFLVSGEESGSKTWYKKYLESSFPRSDAPRRRKLVQSFAEAPSPLQSFFPPDFNASSLEPKAVEHSSATPNSASNKKNSSHNTVVAVVVTAAVTFFVAAALCLCYCRFRRTRSVGRNDEGPLLGLSSRNSVNKEKPGNQSLYTNSKHNKTASSLDANFYMESDALSTSKVETPLEIVAGSAMTSAVEFAQVPPSPLKPPPGRLGTPGRADPSEAHPPPPPAPPPPPPIPSGSPHPPPPGPPPPPPIRSGIKPGPPPPPPPSSAVPPPRPPTIGLKPPRPLPFGPNHPSATASDERGESGAPKTKLKPFFWDKVLANPDHSMVWHQIKSGSFQFNEEMIETLFGYNSETNKNATKKGSSSQDPSTQFIQIIDRKKAQNLSILLKALNVTTEEVCDAIQEGIELPSELLQTLIKMAPTAEEELKLRLYSGELSRLGTAERFLKVLVDIPFAFKRLESLLFMCTLQEEASIIKESFATLEAACTELRKSRLFFKLLEAVLKTGNRMNDGTFRGSAQAFKLDTLLKLSDVKGKDGKTTLLHFVVQEIIRSEGLKAARVAGQQSSIKSDDILDDSSDDSEEHYRTLGLQLVLGLGGELENVKKAAILDADSLTGTVAKLGHSLLKARDFLNSEMKDIDKENGFHQILKCFVPNAEVEIMRLLEEEKRIIALVKNTGDYFHGNAGKDEGLRLFVIVRDFLIILDKVCKEVKNAPRKPNRTTRKEDTTAASSSEPKQSPSPDPRQRIFPAITDRRMDGSSSDDDN